MVAPRTFELDKLASHELAELGAHARRCTEDRAATLDEIAREIVNVIWDAFDGYPPSQLALVRAYRTRLEPPAAPGRDAVRGLVLCASRGLEPGWNEVASAGEPHATPARATIERIPAIARLVAVPGGDPHGHAGRTPRDDNVVFVPDAIGSEHVPAQREFVLRYGVRSVIGFGGVLPDHEGFALVVFARVVIGAEIATAFSTIALQAGLSLSRATDLVASPADRERARAAAYDRLLRLQEYLYIRQSTARAAEAARAASLEATLERAQHVGATKLERIQRAMLNVIADLREARADLEHRVQDRTAELAAANAELRASNSELEQFAYIASHDLQEPLRTISGYLQLLQERYSDRIDGDGLEFISYAVRGAQRMQQLIDALLAYSHVARAPMEVGVVSLERAFEEVLQGMAHTIAESGVAIERPELPVVRGDAIQLRQLFQNLLSNAIKFAGPERPRVEICIERREQEIELSFKDHGIGFDPKYVDQVFKVFRRLQRKLPGTGIGLAICKKIVERHGGTIRAESESGRGTTFYVTLQAAEVR